MVTPEKISRMMFGFNMNQFVNVSEPFNLKPCVHYVYVYFSSLYECIKRKKVLEVGY